MTTPQEKRIEYDTSKYRTHRCAWMLTSMYARLQNDTGAAKGWRLCLDESRAVGTYHIRQTDWRNCLQPEQFARDSQSLEDYSLLCQHAGLNNHRGESILGDDA